MTEFYCKDVGEGGAQSSFLIYSKSWKC